MENPSGVPQDPPPAGSEPLKTQTQETPPPAEGGTPPETPPPGSKTPPENLKAALDEERTKRKEEQEKNKELEDKINKLETATPPVSIDDMSDEGRQLKEEIGQTKQELAQLKEEKILEGLHSKHPALKDKQEEFEEYRKKFPNSPLEVVANSFLVDKDLIGEKPKRKGIEKPSGSSNTPPKTKMTSEEVEDLRKNNYPEYLRKLDSGELRPEDIG